MGSSSPKAPKNNFPNQKSRLTPSVKPTDSQSAYERPIRSHSPDSRLASAKSAGYKFSSSQATKARPRARRPRGGEEAYKAANQVFLATLASGQTIRQSARQAGKSESCFARRRRVDPTFAAAWEEALKIGAPFEADVWRKFLGLVAQGLAINRAARLVGRCIIHLKNRLNHDQALKQAYAEAEAQGRATRLESFRSADLKAFLAAIGSGQTVAQAAKLAGSSLNAVYCLRKHDPKFAQDWAEAIKAKAPKPEIDPPGPKPGQA